MTEVKYFCKPVSKFDISELGLSKEELKYATMAYKSPRYLVNVVREHGWTTLAQRICGILEREDRGKSEKYNYLKAERVSWRICDKMWKAGYIRDSTNYRHHEKVKLFNKILRLCRSWISFGDPISFLHNELEETGIKGTWGWLQESELCNRREALKRLEDYCGCYIDNPWRLRYGIRLYETYDPGETKDTVVEIMCKFLSPKQREVISWVAESDGVGFYTEEEFNLYKAAKCAIIANIYEIKAMFDKALSL